MKVGLLSDSHDNEAAVVAAVEVFRGQGVATLIHCGDVIGGSTLDLLRGFRVSVCLGNNDDSRTLEAAAVRIGGAFAPVLDIRIGGKKFFVAHGDRPGPLTAALNARRHDYVLYGHTHRKDDRREGKTRLINPGALYRAAEYSVAIIDTGTDALEFIEIRC